MKEIEELQEEVTINEMIDVLLLDQLNAIYHQHGSQSNYYAERRDSTRFALLSRFRELEDYKAAFIVLWDFCKEQTHKQIELVKRAEQAEEQVENAKKDKDEAVKDVRIQYDSVCDMFHKREREYEDRITDLNNALINQLETGKQKTIYINQLEKENESLRCCGNCGLSRYDNDYGLSCSYNFKKVKPNDRYCDNWQSDGLTAKDRKE